MDSFLEVTLWQGFLDLKVLIESYWSPTYFRWKDCIINMSRHHPSIDMNECRFPDCNTNFISVDPAWELHSLTWIHPTTSGRVSIHSSHQAIIFMKTRIAALLMRVMHLDGELDHASPPKTWNWSRRSILVDRVGGLSRQEVS